MTETLASPRRVRVRMTAADRRDQLVTVARSCLAEKGFDGTSIEEIAARAGVSKPVVYEHFAGKEAIYAVVVDREVHALLTAIRRALQTPGAGSRRLLELGTMALLDYIEACPEGFQILMRDTSETGGGSFASILNDVIERVEGLLTPVFAARQIDEKAALLYAQALTGLVAMTAQWWLDNPELTKAEVAGHLVNLAWNGLHHLERDFTVEPGPSVTPE
ncbi:MAG: TetR/AcrR family transcriptional regulator [Propionibacteriaceae bacterium]|jgi:AcrR family transcriptional regulator|nr:TetR/AcrR family transcriptional regulator [Propionibacteriaceae bacterium]